MTDFSQTMATMIAQSRPQMPSGQTRPQIIPGSSGALWKGKDTMVGADLGALVQGGKNLYYDITGKPRPLNQEQLLEQAEIGRSAWNFQSFMYRDKDPEKLNTLETLMQTKLKEYHDAGYAGVEKTPEGRYFFLEGPPESVDQVRAKSAAYLQKWGTEGEGATHQKVAGLEDRPKTEAEIQSGMAGEQPRQQFIDTQKQIRAGTPEEQQLAKMQMDTEQMRLQYQTGLVNMLPAQRMQAEEEHQQKLMNMQLEARVLENQELKLRSDLEALKTGATKEALGGIKQVDAAHSAFVNQWMAKHVYTPDTEERNFEKISELAGQVRKHTAGVKAYIDSPGYAEPAIRHWFEIAGKEFRKPTLAANPRTSLPVVGELPFTGNPSETIEGQEARRQYYLKTAVSMVQEAGTDSTYYADQIAEWMAWGGYDDSYINDILRPLGRQIGEPAPTK